MKNRISEHSMDGVYTCKFVHDPNGSFQICENFYKPKWERPIEYNRGLVLKMFRECEITGGIFLRRYGTYPNEITAVGWTPDRIVWSHAE